MKDFQRGQKVIVTISYGITQEGIIEQSNSGYPLYDKSKVKVSGIGDAVYASLISLPDGWVTIKGLYEAGYRAHSGTSFSPEDRGKNIVTDYEGELNEDLKSIPEDEQQRYIESYQKNLFHWLSAKGRCLSSMITGPANFPTRRNEKANNAESSAYSNFREIREKALKVIARKIENDKPEEQRQAEQYEQVQKRLLSSIRTIIALKAGKGCGDVSLFKANLFGIVKTLSRKLDVVSFKKVIDLIKENNIYTDKHKIWLLAASNSETVKVEQTQESKESEESEVKGVKVVKNYQEDRIQLFFDGKPASYIIAELKHKAFKWSPSRSCWQRQLTGNAIYVTTQLLNGI